MINGQKVINEADQAPRSRIIMLKLHCLAGANHPSNVSLMCVTSDMDAGSDATSPLKKMKCHSDLWVEKSTMWN